MNDVAVERWEKSFRIVGTPDVVFIEGLNDVQFNAVISAATNAYQQGVGVGERKVRDEIKKTLKIR